MRLPSRTLSMTLASANSSGERSAKKSQETIEQSPLPSIAPHERRFRNHVPPHRPLNITLGAAGRQVQRRIQRVQSEEIAVLTVGRARPAVTGALPAVFSRCPCRLAAFRDLRGGRRDIKGNPVVPYPDRRVGIVHDQHKAFCVFWDIPKSKR